MATKNIKLGSLQVNAVYLGATKIRKMHLGPNVIWNEPFFVDEPKIDPEHDLANRNLLIQLVNGSVAGMTSVSGAAQVVDNAYASNVAGTLAMHRIALPAPNSRTFRVSAEIKIDKTAGRFTRIGFSSVAAALTSSPDAWIGHTAGSGIVIGSSVGAVGGVPGSPISEAQLVDGAWYRITLTYDNLLDYDVSDTNPGRARIQGAAEPVLPANTPADPWYPPSSDGRFDAIGAGAYVPSSMIVRTNSALGTVRNLFYIDKLYGASNALMQPVDNAPILHQFKQTSATDRTYIYSKGKAAPLRIIIVAGGTGIYGGTGDFGIGTGRSGHPHNAARKFWRELAEKGYTVVHANALHEGWGADDHLVKQIDAIDKLKSEFGADPRLYYIGYSMGGASLWRALRGRAGFPPIRAAYSLAGISRITAYWDINGMYAQARTRWPVRDDIDDPQNYSAAELEARGTRVRMVTSTADTNVDKGLEHDPMYAKYAGTGLASERVLNVGHFDPSYWDATDCVSFFEGADV